MAEDKLLRLLPPDMQPVYKQVLRPDAETEALGKGGGQALRLYQVRRGAEGWEQRVPGRSHADPRRAGGLRTAGGGVFHGNVPP